MKKKSTRVHEREQVCPDTDSLEYTLLSAARNRRLLQLFAQHFLTCTTCQQRIDRLVIFYGILHKELQKPTSPRVKQFASALFVPVP